MIKVLGYGLLYCETCGMSNKLHENEASSLTWLPTIFIKIILIVEAIKIPAMYTKPFKFWLNKEDKNKKNINSVGAIKEKNCNILDKVNAMAILYISYIISYTYIIVYLCFCIKN